MDTNEIDRLLAKEKNFVGTFALDKLPQKKIKVPASFIINNDVSSKKGDHWVSLLITKNQAFYFDSFGLPIIDKQILRFLSRQKFKKVTYSNKCIQSIYSDKCGLFCILFIKIVKNKKKFKNFLKMFSDKSLNVNDQLVVDYSKLNKW